MAKRKGLPAPARDHGGELVADVRDALRAEPELAALRRELAQTRQQLRQAEARLATLAAASPMQVYELDAALRFTYFSPAGPATTAWRDASQLLGKTYDRADPRDAAAWEAQRAVLTARQEFSDFTFRYEAANGETRFMRVCGTPFFDDSGVFHGYRGTTADTTKRLTEATARRRLTRLDDAILLIRHPLVMYDENNLLCAFNEAFADLHRDKDGQCILALGMHFHEIVDWRMKVGFYAAAADGGAVRSDLVVGGKAGETRAYKLANGKWMLKDFHLPPSGGSLGIWTDITELRQAEEKRRAVEAQLHHSQRLEALGTLAGAVAHDLNNALVPVIDLTKLAARAMPQSGGRARLALIVKGAERARDLVAQILAFSRNEEPCRQSFALEEVVRETLGLMRAALPATIELSAVIEATPLSLGDPGQLCQVIVNLIANAAHAIGSEVGRITVSLRPMPCGTRAILAVADNGCGMDEKTRARIFEPFFTTKPVGEGSGLGLAVVHGIVKNRGGAIELASAPGKGTRFEILLPVGAPAAGDAGSFDE